MECNAQNLNMIRNILERPEDVFLDSHCICDVCKFVMRCQDGGCVKVAATDIIPLLELILKVSERFGRCDSKLLRALLN